LYRYFVRTGSVRRRSDAEKLTAKPSVWIFADTVFKGLDCGDVQILNRALEKQNVAQINLSTKLNIAGG